ncbi:hypothetical protein L873DRAFT_1795780 [Choiromyces venosus 120613-1]|uniref:Uncharacterized protein n=1 Tax=Choiromyces venosus 120613-1 TaxID=1336337 RepID=A0A3N4IVU2_9PEZI|nr:hypothetical protein L873DRAFT_1795780 [Choiromyces venosus 120613-1]
MFTDDIHSEFARIFLHGLADQNQAFTMRQNIHQSEFSIGTKLERYKLGFQPEFGDESDMEESDEEAVNGKQYRGGQTGARKQVAKSIADDHDTPQGRTRSLEETSYPYSCAIMGSKHLTQEDVLCSQVQIMSVMHDMIARASENIYQVLTAVESLS